MSAMPRVSMDTIENYYSVLSRQQQDRISGVPAAASTEASRIAITTAFVHLAKLD